MTPRQRLHATVLQNPDIRAICKRWSAVNLPNAWLVAGALAQTVWNARFGLPPGHGISDIDLIYFDPGDLTAAAEQAQAARIRALFPDVAPWIDVKNEARVHLWYAAKFGFAIRPYRSSRDAIDSFPSTATTLALRPAPHGPALHAPFGLDDLFAGVVRPNKRLITAAIYAAKVARWRACWPGLDIRCWDDP